VLREDILLMRAQEWKRLHLIHQALEKKIKQKEAAELAGLSTRQMRRLMKRIREEGDRGIWHRRRGQPSNRRLADKVREKVLGLFEKKYGDFGPTLASEKLETIDRIRIHPETLRLWLRQADIPYPRRKARVHRRWRQRRSCLGEMVQMDGSHHDWLEGRGPKLVLMGYIDDATSSVHARFYDHEGTRPALDSFSRYVERYGIPLSVYLDNHSTYKSTQPPSPQEQLEGVRTSQSQFQRAMKELGVEVIHAHSPAAKGRIERLFQTFQDRLVKEMRLGQISTLEQANGFLETYLPSYNQRFRVRAAQPADLHRRLGARQDLKSILCVKTQRHLNADRTLAHAGKRYQIEDRLRASSLTLEEHLDGSLHIRHQGREVCYREIPPPPVKALYRSNVPTRTVPLPAANHPWRQPYKPSRSTLSPSLSSRLVSRGDSP
jgi:helix-turn-helix protein